MGCLTQAVGWEQDREAKDPSGKLGVPKTRLGWIQGLAAVLDLCLSVLSPAGTAVALPVPLVAAEVHAHLPPVPPAQQPPGQGSPVPHGQETLRQHLRFPVSAQRTARGGCRGADGQGADVGLALSSGSHIENWHSILRNGLVNASYTKLQVPVRSLYPAHPRAAGGQGVGRKAEREQTLGSARLPPLQPELLG